MAEIGDIYPGTNEKVVGVIYNQNGPGRWLQGEFGGLFAEGGAPFLGSYFTLDPTNRNDPNRRFSGIEATSEGGYRQISSNPGELGYTFNPAPPPPSTPAPAPAPTPVQQRATSETGISAKGTLATTLAQYGLPASLADKLWDQEYVQKGTPIQTIIDVALPNTDEYKQRFPGLTSLRERRNRGESVLIPSVTQYLELETGIASVLRDSGLPAGFYDDPSDFATFIGGSTSPKEIEDRISLARNVAFNAPVEVRQELSRVYGLEPGDLVAYFLDPQRMLPDLQKKANAAAVGGATIRSGFGLLTQQEMEQLSASGVTDTEAAQRSGALVPLSGLFAETAGEAAAGDQLGRDEQVGYIGGSAQAVTSIERRRSRRQAQFEGGGGAAAGQGRTGLG